MHRAILSSDGLYHAEVRSLRWVTTWKSLVRAATNDVRPLQVPCSQAVARSRIPAGSVDIPNRIDSDSIYALATSAKAVRETDRFKTGALRDP
jgi:hypothetical protein